MKILLSHSGKQHSYWVAKALKELNSLASFHTSVYISSRLGQAVWNFLGNKFWRRRYIDGLTGRHVKAHWRYELKEMLQRYRGVSSARIFMSICLRDEKFDKHIARGLSEGKFDVYWGFQGSCLESLKVANDYGKTTICEQTAVYYPTYSSLYIEEIALQPIWAETIRPVKYSSTYQQRLIDEPLIADYVIAASNFTKQSLINGGVDANKIRVVALGFDTSLIRVKEQNGRRNKVFKILLVGRLTQEKGLSYLIDAVNSFSDDEVELHLIGGGYSDKHPLNGFLNSKIQLHSAVNQQSLWSTYCEYDVLVLPSLSEGFGLVIAEALTAGLPVIATENSVANDCISNGVNGYVIPIRNAEVIAVAIRSVMNLSAEEYSAMCEAARESAGQFTWDSYKKRIETTLNQIELETAYKEHKIIVSHSGKQHSYYVARGLKRSGNLARFYTSGYLTSKRLQSLVHRFDNTFWSRRFIDGLYGTSIMCNWRFEVKEFCLRFLEGKSKRVQDAVYERDEKFDKYVSAQLKNNAVFSFFWGFQGSCLHSLSAAKNAGKTVICELATAHLSAAKDILGQEALLHPEWEDSIDNLVFSEMYEKRLESEPRIADYCVVASEFTKKTLLDIGILPDKIYKIPLGFDVDYIAPKERIEPLENRPLRLLYAGTVTQRKGIKYLLEAMKSFSKSEVELHIIGGVHGSGKAFEQYSQFYIKHPALSQIEMFRSYKDYDALVLPSLFEGFGLVIVEAMAAGLPVITTEHTIGPELIIHNENGYIIPIRDIDAIKGAISSLRKLSTLDYTKMSKSAIEASSVYSWDKYEHNLKKFTLKITDELSQ